MGEVDMADSKALYCNELVALAGETEDIIMKQLGSGVKGSEAGSAVKLLPAGLQGLVKPSSIKMKR
jgi:hypothetical protein